MLKTTILSTTLALMLLLQGCGQESNKEANEMLSNKEYVLTDLNSTQHVIKEEGSGFTLENAKGKVILLDIFATWCPPCRASASHLSSLQEKYKEDIIVIGLTIEDSATKAKLLEFRNNYKADYTLVNSSENRRLITAVADSLKLGKSFPIPLLAMYKDGKLVNHYIGAVQEEFIESDIKTALGK